MFSTPQAEQVLLLGYHWSASTMRVAYHWAYHAFEDAERFAHVADLAEIEGNDLNLNISRHVDTTEPVETLSVGEALAQLRKAERSCGSPSAAAEARAPPRRGHGPHGRAAGGVGIPAVGYDHSLDHGCI